MEEGEFKFIYVQHGHSFKGTLSLESLIAETMGLYVEDILVLQSVFIV